MTETVREYTPDSNLRDGFLKSWVKMVSRLSESRWLIWQLFQRDLKAVYKQSFIGVFWIFLMPLIALTTFILLNNSGILTVGEITAPYPLYALLGLSLWQIFSAGLVAATNSVTSAGQMIKKINFPMESLVFASVAQALVTFAIQGTAVLVLFAYYPTAPTPYILLAPVAAIPIIALTLGIGFITSLINGVTRDLEKAIGAIVSFLMFVTPVMYAKPAYGILAAAAAVNPLYYLVEVPRSLILTGATTHLNEYVLSTIVALAVFLAGWRTFYLTQTRITERI